MVSKMLDNQLRKNVTSAYNLPLALTTWVAKPD